MINVKHAAEEIRLIIVALLITSLEITGESVISCGDLLPGQYLCSPPIIDFDTQQPCSCSPQNIALVNCTPAPDVICDSLGSNGTFTKEIDCQYTSGKSWKVALSLAVFFGWLGIDRLYLGYYALGLLKFATFGFFFIFHLLDIVLIALQVVGPADGTSYVIDYYGPKMVQLSFNKTASLVDMF